MLRGYHGNGLKDEETTCQGLPEQRSNQRDEAQPKLREGHVGGMSARMTL